MPKSTAMSTASGMLSDLKSRLGFSRGNDDYDGGDFGEYDDFDDEGYNERDDRQYAGYGSDYDENVPVGAYQPVTTRSGRFGRADSTPNLVSIDDVKAHTQAQSDGLPSGAARQGRTIGGRNLIDDRAPAESSPAYNASLKSRERESSTRSDGLNSLFEPTTAASGSAFRSESSAPASTSYASRRGLTVVKPLSYADAERVARALKAGDMVVLSMRATSEDLMKRVLDFSFGAASVLDATVESPAERVFAIARGAGLSEEEKRQLRNQGVL